MIAFIRHSALAAAAEVDPTITIELVAVIRQSVLAVAVEVGYPTITTAEAVQAVTVAAEGEGAAMRFTFTQEAVERSHRHTGGGGNGQGSHHHPVDAAFERRQQARQLLHDVLVPVTASALNEADVKPSPHRVFSRSQEQDQGSKPSQAELALSSPKSATS